MNVRPKNYRWPEFYDRVVDLTKHTFSRRAILRRLRANRGTIPRMMNVVRAISSEGNGRIRYFSKVRDLLSTDASFRAYFEGETNRLPEFFRNRVRRDLGSLWQFLPEGALDHDPHAYLRGEVLSQGAPVQLKVAEA